MNPDYYYPFICIPIIVVFIIGLTLIIGFLKKKFKAAVVVIAIVLVVAVITVAIYPSSRDIYLQNSSGQDQNITVVIKSGSQEQFNRTFDMNAHGGSIYIGKIAIPGDYVFSVRTSTNLSTNRNESVGRYVIAPINIAVLDQYIRVTVPLKTNDLW